MRTTRLLGAFAAATIAAIAPLSAAIAADTNGVGSGLVSSTLLQIDVGDGGSVLSVKLLSDEGTSTIDPKNGAPVSSTSLRAFEISSGVVPALNLAAPAIGTSSTGAEDAKQVSPNMPDVPALSGSVAATLSSVVDTLGARSGLDATVANLSLAGGLLGVPSATTTLGTNAASGQATGNRSISIPSIEVLNLGAVLEGLGLTLADLPLDDLLGLLGGLGITLPDIADPAAVIAAVDDAIDALQGEAGALTDELCNTVDDALGTVGGLAGVGDVADAADDIVDELPDALPPVTIPTLSAQALPVSCDSVTGTVEGLVDDLQTVVGDLVGGILAILDDTSLLSVQGIQVGLVADARSTLESSVAQVTGTIGSVKVGALAVPGLSGLDLTAAADVLAAAGDTVSAAVGSVLAVVNAELANMVDVDVLQISETVGKIGTDYNGALAQVTALSATITPPALLTSALAPTDTASGILDEVGATVPAIAPVMSQLGAALGGLDVLTAPSTITVGRLTSSSEFRPVSASLTPTGELPRTGSDAAVPAMAAVLVGGVALGLRRFIVGVTS